MKHEMKELCRKAWEQDFSFSFYDDSGKKNEGRFCVHFESNNSYIECTPEAKPF